MNVRKGRLPAVDFKQIEPYSDDYLKMLFDYYADQTDNKIQTELVSELMIRYADVSKQLEIYNKHLEEMVQEKVKEISASQMATIHALVKSAESRDDDTGAHVERTSNFCRIIADKLYEEGIYPKIVDEAYSENITKASPLHDIGKVGIKDAILLKPGKLTDEEFTMMKTHVLIGYETLASVGELYPENKFIKTGIEIARYHHEKWDGSGYSSGLSGENIPLSARIMAISDVYDALRSRRVYKEPFTHERATDIITEGRETHFDPVLVDIFLQNNQLFSNVYTHLSA
jgi:putative two-component system response regulator